jgi:hypothetical protein
MSNSGAATPVIDHNVPMNFPNAAASSAAASAGPTLHRTTTVVGHTLTPNGRSRLISHNPYKQDNLDNFTIQQQQIESSAAASGQAAAASTNNSKMNTNQGGKRKRKTLRKTRRTRRNKNKRTRKH